MNIRYKKIAAAVGIFLAAAAVILLSIHPLTRLYRQIFHLPDENGMYSVGDHWLEEMPELNEKSVIQIASKMDKIQTDLLTDQNYCYYAVIPDKSWYVREEGYQTVDQEKLLEIVRQNLSGDFTEIDLSSVLNLDNYYRSDRHWRQETLQPVLDALGDKMDFSIRLSDFTANTFSPFSGSYAEYLIRQKEEENLVYLTNSSTDSAVSDNFQHPEIHTVYDLEKLKTENSYDVYLSGVSPLITIENPNLQNGRELVIFRDSFASSLAPLLLEEYQTITLVDLRFLFSSALPDYLTFTDQDVLFLYSTWIVNNSSMLR
ncbi:MAG: DHHW family protein [Candidatus Merdivicinus sp.]